MLVLTTVLIAASLKSSCLILDTHENDYLELGSPHVKQIKGREKLWELRVQVASDIFRYFYFASAGCKFVILHGIAKKTQKIRSRDLDIAEKRMKDYLGRFCK